jgi:hypothetical protein
MQPPEFTFVALQPTGGWRFGLSGGACIDPRGIRPGETIKQLIG